MGQSILKNSLGGFLLENNDFMRALRMKIIIVITA
jgi:hypothetical protein